MIYKKDLEGLGFEDLTAFFGYLVESKINGNHRSVSDTIKSMSAPQRKEFVLFLREEDSLFSLEVYDKLIVDTLMTF